jgi:hypothetical protein
MSTCTVAAGLWVYRMVQMKMRGDQQSSSFSKVIDWNPSTPKLPGQWDRIWLNEGDDPRFTNEFDPCGDQERLVGHPVRELCP